MQGTWRNPFPSVIGIRIIPNLSFPTPVPDPIGDLIGNPVLLLSLSVIPDLIGDPVSLSS